MSAHTKGPWKVCAYNVPLNEDGCIATDADQEFEIRPAAGQKLGDKAADFRLMAAAPGLIQAAVAAEQVLAVLCLESNHASKAGAALEMLRSAIANSSVGQP